MKKITLLFTFFAISSLLIAQKNKPSDWGLKKYAINDPKLGLIEYFIDTVCINKLAPVMLYLQSSEGMPIILSVNSKIGNGEFEFFNYSLMQKCADKYHFVIISKPGVPFFDTISNDSADLGEIMLDYHKNRISNDFYNKISLDFRADVASKVLDKVTGNLNVQKNKIVVWGSSEGGMVCPLLAVKNKKVTHVVSEVGTALTPFYSQINRVRASAIKGEISYIESQRKVDSLLLVFKDIVEDPSNTEKTYFGMTYKYWNTHLSSVTIDDWVKLNIPIFIVAGAKDMNVPVACTDLIILELIKNKRDLTYRILAEGAHDMVGTRPYDDEIIKWIEK